MAFDILKFLYEDGYVVEGKDNLVHAEKAFLLLALLTGYATRRKQKLTLT